MFREQTANGLLPLVSVIIVSFNCIDYLRKCLSSLMLQTYTNIEIIVIDNGSSEDIFNMLKNKFPTVQYLRLEKNYGFAAGNNAGIRISKGKYVALINNDAQAEPEWLEQLVIVAESNTKTGAVASLIIDGNNPSVLDSCGVVVALDGMSCQARHGMPSHEKLEKEQVLAFSGCACLLRKEALAQTGLFDEHFFAYCEDTDLSLRLLWAGWNITTAPDAKVIHFYSKTGGAFSLHKIFWIERNHYWVAIKNFPITFFILLPLISFWRYMIQLYALLRGYGKVASFVNKGSFAHVAGTILYANLAAIAGMIPAITARLYFFQQHKAQTSRTIQHLIFEKHASMKEIVVGAVQIASDREHSINQTSSENRKCR